jgi:hypothetical protein
MKNFIFLICIFLLISCKKDNQSIRLKNYLSQPLTDVKVSTATIGAVGAGQMSNYVLIPKGDFLVTGKFNGGSAFSANGSIHGVGKHKWTIYMDVSGNISIAED